MECEYCNNKFATSSNLKSHQRTAKYCLKIRNKCNIEFKCTLCNSVFSKNQRLQTHLKKCEITFSNVYEIKNQYKVVCDKNQDLENQIVDYKKMIKELQDKLENIALKAITKPTTTIQNNTNNSRNQIINNLTPITDEHLKEQSRFLTIDHIKDGASGYAKYALEYPLKDKVICVDYSRRKVKYKDEEGNLVDDPEMTKLAKKFFMAIESHNTDLVNNYNNEMFQKVIDVGSDNNEMTQEEADKCIELGNALLTEMFKIKSMKTDIDDIKKGNKPELLHEFVKDVCSNTTC
jgi:hypothetical protein